MVIMVMRVTMRPAIIPIRTRTVSSRRRARATGRTDRVRCDRVITGLTLNRPWRLSKPRNHAVTVKNFFPAQRSARYWINHADMNTIVEFHRPTALYPVRGRTQRDLRVDPAKLVTLKWGFIIPRFVFDVRLASHTACFAAIAETCLCPRLLLL